MTGPVVRANWPEGMSSPRISTRMRPSERTVTLLGLSTQGTAPGAAPISAGSVGTLGTSGLNSTWRP